MAGFVRLRPAIWRGSPLHWCLSNYMVLVEEIVLACIPDGCGTITHTKLLIDLREIPLDRTGLNTELLSNFRVLHTGSSIAQDLKLAWAEVLALFVRYLFELCTG